MAGCVDRAANLAAQNDQDLVPCNVLDYRPHELRCAGVAAFGQRKSNSARFVCVGTLLSGKQHAVTANQVDYQYFAAIVMKHERAIIWQIDGKIREAFKGHATADV